jgi:hypothetical protein
MDNPISKSIDHFTGLVLDLPDSELEREWVWGSYKSEGVRFAYFRTYEDLRQLVVQIGQKRGASGMQLSDAQRILAQYHAAYMDLQAVLLGVEERYFEEPPAEGEWSIRRVLAHIVGADMGFYVAIKFALDKYSQGKDPLVDIDDETWLGIIGLEAEELDAQMDEPLPGLQSFHRDLHERVLVDFSLIDASVIDKPSKYWEDEFYSVRFRLHRFDAHMSQHTIQIEKTLQAIGYVPTESQRLLRLVYAALGQVNGALIGTGIDYQDLLSESVARIDERTAEIGNILAN